MTNPITKILAAIAKPTMRSSNDLRRDLAAVDLETLEAKVAAFELERRRLLLSGSNAELRASEQQLADARLEVERGTALIDELQRRIGEAEKREAAEAIDAQAVAAREASNRLTARYAEIDSTISNLVSLLGSAGKECSSLSAANARFARAGREDLKIKFTDVLVAKQRAHKALQ